MNVFDVGFVMTKNFSVCMSVYKNDNAEHFERAVMSIYHQTLQPSEIVLVIDGPIPSSLQDVINRLQRDMAIIKVIPLPRNMGHAIARQTAIDAASNELCAIMDADDIAVPTRFEQQVSALEKDKEIDVVGGQIDEFIGNEDNIVGSRVVPLEDGDIKNYLKSRCPMNLMTVMLRKSGLLKVGGFIDWFCEEDYYLWIRMMLAGAKFHNLPETLVNVRVGKEMYQRRGGGRYFKSEAKLQMYMLSHHVISVPRFVYNVMVRFIVQVAMPNTLRGWVFRTFARK